MSRKVYVKFADEFYAVMIRSCSVTGAIDTMLFKNVEFAKRYCQFRWRIPIDDWEPYLVAQDPNSTIKLNGEGVRYCGWKHDCDETESLHIHLERQVLDFSFLHDSNGPQDVVQ